jgi:hypothetical protein
MNTKTFSLFSLIILAAVVPVTVALAAPAGQLTQSSGYVTVSSPQTAPKSVGTGEPVESGQTVTLGDGARAVIKFQDGQIVALQPKSIFKINNYKYEQAALDKSEVFFSLLQGGLRAITGLIGNGHKEGWKLATPTATMGIRGTDFMVVVDQGIFVKVDAGAVSATNSAGTAVFTAGETAAVATGSALGAAVPAYSIPAGTFSELSAINLGAIGGAATGSTAAASSTILGVPSGVVIGVGIAAGAAAAASGGGSSTTTHH